MGRIDKLKSNGRIVAAQATTTTERYQINVAHKYCWHCLIESEWKEMRCKTLPPAIFKKLFPHFMHNLDKTCMVCSNGVLEVMRDRDQNQDKNVQAGRCSVTMLRSGRAASLDGPICFIANGKGVTQP